MKHNSLQPRRVRRSVRIFEVPDSQRRLVRRRKILGLVDLSNCQDDIDYLNSMDNLSDFPLKDLVSIKLGNREYCFPKESITKALHKSAIIFASTSIRYKISGFISDRFTNSLRDSFVDLGSNALTNEEMIHIAEETLDNNNNWGIPKKVFENNKKVLEFFRFYKWPIASDLLISSQSFNNFVKSKTNLFKLVNIGSLKDVSGFNAHGVGAVHGKKELYDIVPINSNSNKRKLGFINNNESYFSTSKEYSDFNKSINNVFV